MKKIVIFITCIFLFFLFGCSFDYGDREPSGEEQPGLIMENVEYVRVRSADPKAKFLAERAERYEKQGVMRIQNLTFEQYGGHGEEVNALGSAGYASVEIQSGDIFMDQDVRIEVETEDITIETYQLEWRDEPHTLSTPEENEVTISQDNGTSFTGTGLHVSARDRQWEFKGNVSGLFIHDDIEIEETAETETIEDDL
ncbi:MAG: LPS export ABC transporter periplasmic protein LptC [Treponema sp.]|jgi:LPS export ABC transporter protein LptC|nr:LPS export ABC transporter periplasmic protein LptC [Treponema sp.]